VCVRERASESETVSVCERESVCVREKEREFVCERERDLGREFEALLVLLEAPEHEGG